jgi:hypothetical protein
VPLTGPGLALIARPVAMPIAEPVAEPISGPVAGSLFVLFL